MKIEKKMCNDEKHHRQNETLKNKNKIKKITILDTQIPKG